MLNFGYNPEAVSVFEAPNMSSGFSVQIGGSGSSGGYTPPVFQPSTSTAGQIASSSNPSNLQAGTSIIAILVVLLLLWIAMK